MAVNIKNAEVEQLLDQVVALTGETKTEAMRKALEERRVRLRRSGRAGYVARVTRYLEREVWPNLPPGTRGRGISKDEREDILGYGPEGV